MTIVYCTVKIDAVLLLKILMIVAYMKSRKVQLALK
jgi:hypothetical protein